MTSACKVNPHHYTRYAEQPVQLIVKSLGPAFLVANIIKYALRYDAKDGVEDVKKLIRYGQFLLNHLEGRDVLDDGQETEKAPQSCTPGTISYTETVWSPWWWPF